MGEAAGAPGRTGHSSRRYASPTKNASEIASRSKRGVRGQKFNVGGKACRLLFYRGRASGFQGAEPTGLPPHSTHWYRHGLAEPEPPIKGLAPRFAGFGSCERQVQRREPTEPEYVNPFHREVPKP